MVENINREVANQMLRAINERDYEVFNEIMAAEFTDHHPDLGEGINSREEYVAELKYFIEALDVEAELDLVMTKEDYTIVHGTMKGQHQKEFLDMEPTENQVEWTFIEVYRLEEGVIVERWALDDTMSLLSGLGVKLF